MSLSKTAAFIAQIHANGDDEDEKAQLRVTEETTLAEVLKFYQYRKNEDGSFPMGFSIKLSPAKARTAKRSNEASSSASLLQEASSTKRVKLEEHDASHASSSSSPAVAEAAKKPLKSSSAGQKPKPEPLPRKATGKTYEDPITIPSALASQRSRRGVVEDTAWFTVRVRMLDGKDLHFRIQQSTSLETICRKACELRDLPYAQMRFVRGLKTFRGRDGPDPLLIRDPEASELLASKWDLGEGSMIYALMCLCGC